MSDRATRRARALETWRLIQSELHRGHGVPTVAHDYLREVCDLILGPLDTRYEDDVMPVTSDPLMLARPAGNQPDPQHGLALARAVRERLVAAGAVRERRDAGHPLTDDERTILANGNTLADATENVAEECGVTGGGTGGSIEKAYRQYSDAEEASASFYAAINAGDPPPRDSVRDILAGPKKRKKPGSQSE